VIIASRVKGENSAPGSLGITFKESK
jgi:hypothetical protein